jgi:hypothetical protein
VGAVRDNDDVELMIGAADAIASSQGKAMAVPSPCNMVRLEIVCIARFLLQFRELNGTVVKQQISVNDCLTNLGSRRPF